MIRALGEACVLSLIRESRKGRVSALLLLLVFATLPSLAQQPADHDAQRPQSNHQRIEEMRPHVAALPIGDLLKLARDSLDQRKKDILSRVVIPELRHRILADDDTQAILEVVGRGDESESMRALIIGVLRHHFTTLRPEDQRVLLADSTRIGLDSPALSTELRVPAVLCANEVVVTLSQNGALTRDEIEHYAQRLNQLMMDASQDHYLRRAAVQGVALLRYSRAAPQLLAILEQEETANDPVLVRSTCIALADLGVTEAVAVLGRLLETTGNPGIFASVACALGDLGTEEALGFLVANAGRFDDGSCGVAIARQKRLILALLDENAPDLLSAIRATKYLYNEEDEKAYKAKLFGLLPRLADDSHIAATLTRLSEVATQSECASILEKVPRRTGYAEEWDTVRLRSLAVTLEPISTDMRVDEH